MKRSKHGTAAAGVLLAAVVITGGLSAGAAGGSEGDPLVTLSYLTQVLTPQLMDEVDRQVAANEQALADKLDAAIHTYTQDMEAALGQGGGGAGAAFTVVPVQAGQALVPGTGCELLLRTGAAKVSASETPALLDTTAGGTLESGGALAANHLYLSPGEGRTISISTAGSFLVRGSYTLD